MSQEYITNLWELQLLLVVLLHHGLLSHQSVVKLAFLPPRWTWTVSIIVLETSRRRQRSMFLVTDFSINAPIAYIKNNPSVCLQLNTQYSNTQEHLCMLGLTCDRVLAAMALLGYISLVAVHTVNTVLMGGEVSSRQRLTAGLAHETLRVPRLVLVADPSGGDGLKRQRNTLITILEDHSFWCNGVK